MKKIQRGLFGCVLILLFIVTQTGCAGKAPVSQTDFLLNTVCTITIYEGGDEELIREAFALCREYENKLSRTIPTSDIGRINAAQGSSVSVDKETAEVIRKAIEYGELSEGLFDITVGELSELWNFSGDNPSVPDEGLLKEAVTHIGYPKIRIMQDENTAEVQLEDAQAKLDLGGIAKGYIADRAAEFLEEKGVTSATINLGGNVVCIGEKAEGTPFRIGIEKPFGKESQGQKEILGLVPLKGKSIVTSGTYERKFTENGTLYYHILDPKTGYPRETDLDGVSIIGPQSADCDGLSTTCLMLGFEKGKALIDSMNDYEAIFVKKDGSVVTTAGVSLIEE